jgi:hypothetical protein
MAQYEVNASYRSNYSALSDTYCGKGIPKRPFVTFTPPLFPYTNSCPGEWTGGRAPLMNIQQVTDYKTKGYRSLTHDAPPTESGYFMYEPAYGKPGYTPMCRVCDGGFTRCAPDSVPVSSVALSQ